MNNSFEFQRYSVGDVFDMEMDGEGALFEVQDNMCKCVIGLNNISEKELQAVEKGNISVKLIEYEGITFIGMQFDKVLQFDMPFNMGVYDKCQFEDPGNLGYTVLIFLLDNSTNCVMAMRAIGLNNEFSRKLYEISVNQCEHQIENYNQKIDNIYQSISTEELLKNYISENVFGG